ncbi:iron-containing alcohol dehydrogenase, partial [candidate division KSB1 bacterium]|nr:iron-containing alcohol dehydrogenase [candidate division KSB1 bacterium]
FGIGVFERLGELAGELGFRRTLLVADHGMVACGYAGEASKLLQQAGIEVFTFHDFSENPDTTMVELGRICAVSLEIDSIIGLGGGSSMDCAKGINFVLTNGGTMRDYWGYGKAPKPMLPMIGIPTTAGTGSEAQCYTLISDAETHVKMACGDPKATFKIAILDPRLTITQPESLTATAGYDAISHAVESYVTKNRNPISAMYSREAWRLLEANYERVLAEPRELTARGAMLLGAYYAGVAIENSMLGATHACANPLTKNYGTTHGVAIALMLPHVVRWNAAVVADHYHELNQVSSQTRNGKEPGEGLADRLEQLRLAGGLPFGLSHLKIRHSDLPMLAEEAAKQWTGSFNPREWNAEGALEVYRLAL